MLEESKCESNTELGQMVMSSGIEASLATEVSTKDGE